MQKLLRLFTILNNCVTHSSKDVDESQDFRLNLIFFFSKTGVPLCLIINKRPSPNNTLGCHLAQKLMKDRGFNNRPRPHAMCQFVLILDLYYLQ